MTTTPVSFGGLESGLNTSEIISAEMQVFEQPLNSLQAQQSTLTTQISFDYQTINSQLLSLQQAADALANPIAYDEAFSASSSNSSIATGIISPRDPPRAPSPSPWISWLPAPRRYLRAPWPRPTTWWRRATSWSDRGGSALGLTSFTARVGPHGRDPLDQRHSGILRRHGGGEYAVGRQ